MKRNGRSVTLQSVPSDEAMPGALQGGAYGTQVIFSPGQRVRVMGLKTRTELNGLQATVKEWDASECRWKVWMDDGSGKMFKPEHVEAVAESDPLAPVNETIRGQSGSRCKSGTLK